MTNTQINNLAQYIIDLEEGLYEYDYDDIAMKTELPIVPAEDKEKKIVLASMEMKLRKCYDCIKRRIGANN